MAWPTSITKVHVDQNTDDPSQGRIELEAAIDAINAIIAGRATADGVCELDGTGQIPLTRYQQIEAGTKVLFVQATVPTGWNFVAANNDRLILNTSTQAEGGTTGGSWTISGLTFDHHHYTSGTTGGSNNNRYDVRTDHNQGAATVSHGHSFAAWSGSPYNTARTAVKTTVDSSGAWRPSYLKVITCQKA